MTELPAVFHRRAPGFLNIGVGAAFIVAALSFALSSTHVALRVVSGVFVLVGFALIGTGAASLRQRLVVSQSGIAIRNVRREDALLWSDIQGIRVKRVRGRQWGAQPATYSACLLLAGPAEPTLRCRVLDDFSQHKQFSDAVAAAGHSELDHLAVDRVRFAERDPFAEPLAVSEILRLMPLAFLKPRISLTLLAVGGAITLAAWGLTQVTGGRHDGLGWALTTVSVVWAELSRRDLWMRRRAARRAELTP